jgi:SAM-dependent methyltransferase
MNKSFLAEPQLEATACPLCYSPQSTLAYSGFEPYGVVRCDRCNFYYLSPRLTEAAMLQEYQKDSYFEGDEGGYDSYLAQSVPLRATFRRLMQNLKRRGIKGHSLLEVGCGYGYLLAEAQSDFPLRVGTDFSAQAAKQAQQYATRIYEGGIEALPLDEQFDCVITAHVIEHVYEPKAFVHSLKAHTKPGGTLVIATPHMGSLWRRMMGQHWPSFKLPEHVLYFDQVSLSRLMTEAGLMQLTPIPYPHAFPLPLIAAKLGIALPKFLDCFSFWLPGTTLAIAGTCPPAVK